MGADMATMEMLLIMVMVVQRFRLALVAGHREEIDCVLDMLPRHGVRATLRRQRPVPARPMPASVPAVGSCPFAALHGVSA
jgi:hypothetical protein